LNRIMTFLGPFYESIHLCRHTTSLVLAMLWPLIYNIVKEFAKIVGLPQILKLPLFAGHPSMWQMFVYSIFSDKNKLRDVCRLPILKLIGSVLKSHRK
jgi:hypothetical protein